MSPNNFCARAGCSPLSGNPIASPTTIPSRQPASESFSSGVLTLVGLCGFYNCHLSVACDLAEHRNHALVLFDDGFVLLDEFLLLREELLVLLDIDLILRGLKNCKAESGF